VVADDGFDGRGASLVQRAGRPLVGPISGLLEMTNVLPGRWRACGPYVAALLIFLSSRMVVYFAIQFATRFVPRNNLGTWAALPLPDPTGGTYWYHRLLRWDAAWYYSILSNGYHFNGDNLVQQPVVFFPLYPLIARVVTLVPGVDGYTALLIVANVAAVLAVLALFKLVRVDHGTRSHSRRLPS
jgi:hypothetical protein